MSRLTRGGCAIAEVEVESLGVCHFLPLPSCQASNVSLQGPTRSSFMSCSTKVLEASPNERLGHLGREGSESVPTELLIRRTASHKPGGQWPTLHPGPTDSDDRWVSTYMLGPKQGLERQLRESWKSRRMTTKNEDSRREGDTVAVTREAAATATGPGMANARGVGTTHYMRSRAV